MRRIVYGLAAGVLAGLLWIGVSRREKPIETDYVNMTREVKEYLKENTRVQLWEYQPFRHIPVLETLRLGDIREGFTDVSTKYGQVKTSVNRYGYFCISCEDIPVFFADIDGDASPDEFFSCRLDDPNYDQKSGKRKIEEIRQPFRFILEGVYKGLLREAHRKLVLEGSD